ncbi:serine/threonine protein kinase with TPR repeats [Haloferula helveola]|uniref:Serine/threonine protein kinase with TPR repeats n=1 Tax=Haloferula helveola TaxID=490095 RepID=A0ABN6HCK3_9BACT|nr:serine/threonine protein kinase with TPR repeats [Haloferula helveola]
MNDDTNQPLEPVGDDALEARIVAWVLGEASPFEAAELEKQVEEDPELKLFVRRIRMLDGLVAENGENKPDADWRLPEAKRWQVMKLLGEDDESKKKTRRRSMPWWSVAAALVVLTVAFWGAMAGMGRVGNSVEMSPEMIVAYSAAAADEQAQVEVTREFHYNTEYEPPELPNGTSNSPRFSRQSGAATDGWKEDSLAAMEGVETNDSISLGSIAYRSRDAEVAEQSIDGILPAPQKPAIVLERDKDAPVASNTVAPAAVPVPEPEAVEEPSIVFSDGDGFGNGWGVTGGGGGGFNTNSTDEKNWKMNSGDAGRPGQVGGGVAAEKGVPLLGDIPVGGRLFGEDESKDGEPGGDRFYSGTAGNVNAPADPEGSVASGPAVDPFYGVNGGTSDGNSNVAGDPFGDANMDDFVTGLENGRGRAAKDRPEPPPAPATLPTEEVRYKIDDSGPVPTTRLANPVPDQDGRTAGRGGEVPHARGMIVDRIPPVTGQPEPPAENAEGLVQFQKERQAENKKVRELDSTMALGIELERLERAVPDAGLVDGRNGALAGGNAPDDSKPVSGSGNISGYSKLVEQEMLRRQLSVAESDRKRDDARDAYSRGEYDEARERYRESLEVLPDAPLMEDRKGFLKQSLADAEVASAEESRRMGRYEEAEQLLDSALKRDPGNEYAKRAKEALQDPIRTNPAMTGKHDEQIEAVRSSLVEAEGKMELGDLDGARTDYEDALKVDPYNMSARRGLEKVGEAQSSYYRAAYDQTRAELLSQVDASWEMTVPPVEGEKREVAQAAQLQKLNEIVIPEVDFKNVSVAEALDTLKAKALEADPSGEGINLFLKTPDRLPENDMELGGGSEADSRISELRLRNVPLGEALNYVAEASRMRWFADDHSVVVKPATEAGEDLQTRTFEVAPDFIARLATETESTAGVIVDDPFAAPTDSAALQGRTSVRDLLVRNGVHLGPDSSVQYFPENSTLLVRGTGTSLELVEELTKLHPVPEPVIEPLDLMEEVSAADEPYSTFSLHVSDSSFKVAAAAMERGEIPDKEGIRPEEFYNAFDYGDPSPANGEPVACVIEQSAHPAFPQRNLMRVAVRTGAAGRGQSTPLNLTLLLDNSGSMERDDRAAGVGQAVEQLASLLQPGDKISVAGFARQPRLLADRLDGSNAAQLNGLVAQLPAEGGTNLEDALTLGSELATRQFIDGAQNRVVLFTDGAANLGDADPESLNRKVEELRNNGIAFDAAGFGADGLNDRLLERLTRNGNGRYYVVDTPEEADAGFAKKLAGAFRPAAENVKVQVVFNPDRINLYKLIGFEEHRLKKEDFRNDAVDAAEMASEEAGVALYQFEVKPEGRGEVGEVRVRFRDAATGRMVERNWTIPYDPQAPAFDRAAPSLQLAGLAAFTAERLRDAPMAAAVDFRELAPVVGNVAAKYTGAEPVEKLNRMIGQLR